MEAMSPVFAALGVTGYEALDDLAHWLDGSVDPAPGAEASGWAKNLGDLAIRAAFGTAGREG